MIVGYDDGCHYHAYVTNSKRAQATPEAKIIAQQDVVIDTCHLRGHTDPRCKAKFNSKKHKQAKNFNTQVAEQTFSWFSRFKHIGRHMGMESYWILILGLFHERNKICTNRHHARRCRKENVYLKLSFFVLKIVSLWVEETKKLRYHGG